MGRTLVFLLGAMALALLIFFCSRYKVPLIQEDIAKRTTGALAESNFQFAKVRVDGRDVLLEGIAPDVDTRKLAEDTAASVRGVNSVDNRLKISEPVEEPVASPYRTVITREEGSLVLTGVVPDEESRAWLVGEARDRFGGEGVRDELEFAKGTPENWRRAMAAVLTQVEKFETARIETVDAELRVNGRVRSPEIRDEVRKKISEALPENFKVIYEIETVIKDSAPVAEPEAEPQAQAQPPQEEQQVDAQAVVEPQAEEKPPYATRVEIRDRQVVVSGMVPDEDAQLRLLNSFKARFGADNVRDQLEITAGAPDCWSGVMDLLADHLGGFDEAAVSLVGDKVEVKGTLLSEEAKKAFEESFSAALPEGVDPTVEIGVVDKERLLELCQQRFNRVLSGTTILFNSASSRILPESFGTLDRLAEIFKECREVDVEVGGHTDSRGDDRSNMKLSSDRAASVVDYLVKKGVPADRLHAVGYGETRPVAENDTEQGQAKNRRIEFKVGRR